MKNKSNNDYIKKKDLTVFAQKINKNVENQIEVAVAQITHAVGKALENHPTKDDHNRLEKKVNELDHKVNELDHKVNELDHKVENLSSDVSDVRRRVIDLEHDTPTRDEFDNLKRKVDLSMKS